MNVSLIVAADVDDCIGGAGELPWHLPEDLRRFQQLTTGGVCVVGARTQDSIINRLGHPLSNRISVVVTRWPLSPLTPKNVIPVPDPQTAMRVATDIASLAKRDEVFVIGGARIYASLLAQVNIVHLTRVQIQAKGDTYIPACWLDDFELVTRKSHLNSAEFLEYSFETYLRRADDRPLLS